MPRSITPHPPTPVARRSPASLRITGDLDARLTNVQKRTAINRSALIRLSLLHFLEAAESGKLNLCPFHGLN